MFVVEEAPLPLLGPSGLRLIPLSLEPSGTAGDLTLGWSDAEGLGWFEYRADLFDADTIARMADRLGVLLEGIVADPDRRLSELPLLTAAERHQVLVAWNDTRASFPEDACLHQLFERQVARTPDATALVSQGTRLTYRELDCRAGLVARYLRGLGVGPESVVGVCMERCADLLVSLLGVLKAGGAYVPLDPAYPRIAWPSCWRTLPRRCCSRGSGCDGRAAAERGQVRVPRLGLGGASSAAAAGRRPPTGRDAGRTSRTSSTPPARPARPKGVMIEHRSAVVNFLAWAQRAVPGRAERRRARRVTSHLLRPLGLRSCSRRSAGRRNVVRGPRRRAATWPPCAELRTQASRSSTPCPPAMLRSFCAERAVPPRLRR